MSAPTDLNSLSAQLDNELARVNELEKKFRSWADEQRQKFDEIREHKLKEGDIHMTEFHNILNALTNIETANEETRKYLIDTFTLLCA